MAEPFIIAENLSYTYTDEDGDSTDALKGVSFTVNDTFFSASVESPSSSV